LNVIKAIFLLISSLLLFKDNTLKTQTSDDSLRLIWNNEPQLDSIRFDALTEYHIKNSFAHPDLVLIYTNDHYQ
jgi:hypothetical protein